MLKKIEETIAYIRHEITTNPEIGIVLGTGLGGLANEIIPESSLPYKDIPNFPESTVKGHEGRLIFGKLGDKNVVAMQGRFHYYEGYSMQELTFPIRVLKKLGIKLLILSNAAGGVNPGFEIGDLMVIKDHINLMGNNPLLGPNDDSLGPRFPDMSETYDKKIIRHFTKIARSHSIHFQTGVYAAVSGPTFETPAEYKYIRVLGADAVGMSTVPEAIVARHMMLPVFAVSIISDLGVEGKIVEISHEEVIDAAARVEPKMTLILKEMISKLEL
ncbi:MAG: purine-nucleoside phosphorylase [Bacteroidales bacterium]|nr:purine-nucleoside phosphorylase [Bacteroidales bacterium]MCF8403738.1 purine-nucleoside phosphorylase [Bacteroidales bacterium]